MKRAWPVLSSIFDMLMVLAARAVCWLRLVSVIMNPSPSSDRPRLVNSFSERGRQAAQMIVSKNISASVGALTTRLLSSRTWSGDIPEKTLWEGNSGRSAAVNSRRTTLTITTIEDNGLGVERDCIPLEQNRD